MGAAMALVGAQALPSPSVAQSGAKCWRLYWLNLDQASNPDAADEVVCLTSATAGVIRQSFTFGVIATKCGKVTGDTRGGALNLSIDYSAAACRGLPSHTIVCPSSAGARLSCVMTMTKDNSRSDVYLVPER
jgi:hypothetical protein